MAMIPHGRCRSAAVAAGLLLVHFALHAAPSDLATRDDADQFVFAQKLELGYHEQPPLYSWLVWAAFQITGPSLIAYAAVKTLVLALLAAAAWAAAGEAVPDDRWRLPAAAGAVLLPSLGWHVATYLTHSNLLLAACYATVALALRVGRTGRARDYIALGVAVGLGGLTKYNYAHFVGSLVLAGLSVPAYRWKLLNVRILLTAVTAGAIVLPHALWLVEHWSAVWPQMTVRFGGKQNSGGFAGAAAGLGQLPLNLLLLVGPFAAVAHWAVTGYRPQSDAGRLLERTFVGALLVLVILAVGGAGRMHERWLIPVVFLVPLAAAGRAAGSPGRATWAVVAACVGILLGHGIMIAVGGRTPFPATEATALDVVADAAGPGGVILAETRELAGAFAYRFPDRRVLCEQLPAFRPWPTDTCVIVWASEKSFPVRIAESPAPRTRSGVLRLNYLPVGY